MAGAFFVVGIVSRFAGALLDVAFPSHCVGCGESVEESQFSAICQECSNRLQFIESPRCLTCGFPFFGETESQEHCVHCEHLSPEFRQSRSMALFRGPLRGLIYSLKYENGLWSLRDLRRIAELTPELSDYISDAVLVPVPLHPRKLRERGYNQSERIARLFENEPWKNRVEDLLVRSQDTVSQTQFNRRDRIRNLKNAFSLQRKRAIDPAQRYLIVDDVFTTGSTVNACAAVLRREGAACVDVLTVGHG